LDSEGRLIETTEPIVCDYQYWQLHRDSQITDEIIRANRHLPATCSFHDDVFNPVLKSMKSGEHIFDLNIRFLNQTAPPQAPQAFLTKSD
jgi:hypothetical protein